MTPFLSGVFLDNIVVVSDILLLVLWLRRIVSVTMVALMLDTLIILLFKIYCKLFIHNK